VVALSKVRQGKQSWRLMLEIAQIIVMFVFVTVIHIFCKMAAYVSFVCPWNSRGRDRGS